MMDWAKVFMALTVIGGVLGFSGVSEGSASFSQVASCIFLVLSVLSLILEFNGRSKLAEEPSFEPVADQAHDEGHFVNAA